jgi:hypothetical protein
VFITAVPIIKMFAWGEGDSRGHVLRETTSLVLCGLVCPSRTSVPMFVSDRTNKRQQHQRMCYEGRRAEVWDP